MNLFGWDLAAFQRVVGSQDSTALEQATRWIEEVLPQEATQHNAKAWLHTLVMDGYPLRRDRGESTKPAEGALLTVQMETEVHAIAAYCLAHTIARDDQLDLAGESSNWTHQAIGALYRELALCGFTKSKSCGAAYFAGMAGLSNGTPLFGDDFRTEWSFYTYFSNEELAALVPIFQAAASYQRTLPEGYPVEVAPKMATSLSDSGREFVLDLTKWLGQIQQAGQDAFVLWW